VVSLTAVYVITLGIRQFLFASNDLVDVMSYSLYLQDNSLYRHDFYIQHIAGQFPNERIAFASMLAWMGKTIRWMSFFAHAAFSMLLLAGMYKTASLFIGSRFFRWMVPLVLIGPLYGIAPGDCELYYNMFIASLVAKAIGIWAVYYFIRGKYDIAFGLLIPATFIHPTVGAQLFLIVSGVQFYEVVFRQKTLNWLGILVFLSTAGTWLVMLQLGVHKAGHVGTDQLFEIFEFRLAHHFFPAYFHTKDWVVGLILVATGLFYFTRRKNTRVAGILVVAVAGMLIYTLSVQFFPLSIVLSSQWFKSYIWTELFGIIAGLALIENLFRRKLPEKALLTLIWILGAGSAIGIHSDLPFFSERKYELFYRDYSDSEADIARKAREHTPKDALFMVPMEFTGFKYYSQRSLYIDYKSVVHRKDALPEWYERIGLIYGIGVEDRRAVDDLYDMAKKNYLAITEEDLVKFRALGIDYLVSYAKHILPLEIVASNTDFLIYDLSKVRKPQPDDRDGKDPL
jgi:hypothetical protein